MNKDEQIGPGFCDFCGEYKQSLRVINERGISGMCYCEECSGEAQSKHVREASTTQPTTNNPKPCECFRGKGWYGITAGSYSFCDKYGYSIFLGWSSFVCRNPRHAISKEIFLEFKRVFGRPVTIRD